MINLKSFDEYINEARDIQKIIRDLARHLAFDKDVIKYLNTSRSKREMGWRELLSLKLRGRNSDYINYITKQMVADLNKGSITGPTTVKVNSDDFDNPDEVEIGRFDQLDTVAKKLDDLNTRLEDIENTFGVDPDDEETLEKTQKKSDELGFDVIEDDEKDSEQEEE